MIPWTVVLILFCSATVWLRLSVTSVRQELRQTQQKVRKILLENERLSLERIELKSPKRLEKLARSPYGFRPPHIGQTVYLPLTTGQGSAE